MKKWIKSLLIFVCILSLAMGFGTTSSAYTEEEKAQAKAWLSAHGYSPDMAGANQAYQDYLNGKFDEELGITTTEVSTGEVTTEQSTGTEEVAGQNPENETTTAPAEEKAVKDDSKNEDKKFSSSGTVSETEGNTDFNTNSAEAVERSAKNDLENQKEVQKNLKKESENNISKDEKQPQEITLYREENKDNYKEAGLVIAVSVLFMLGIVCLFLLAGKG